MKPLAPDLNDPLKEATESPVVSGNAVIPVVASELLSEHPLLAPELVMSMLPAPIRHTPQRTAQSILGRLLLDDPISLT
jgi:hypothetical protein